MSTLSSLESTLRHLQEKKRVAEEKLRLQKQRKKDIERIVSDINRNFNDDINKISKYSKEIAGDVYNGVNGSRNMRVQSEIISDEYEKYPDLDLKLSACLSSLHNELTAVIRKIEELENEIEQLKSQIYYTQDAIRAEIRRIENERAAREAAAREAAAKEEKSTSSSIAI